MTRKEIKRFLEGQLKFLKEQQVEELMKEGRIQELRNIVKPLDYSPVQEFCSNERIALQASEIPEEYLYEIVLYVNDSKIEDDEWFANYSNVIEMLNEKGEIKRIAKFLDFFCILQYNLKSKECPHLKLKPIDRSPVRKNERKRRVL